MDRELLIRMLMNSAHAALVEAIMSSARTRLPILCDSSEGVRTVARLASILQISVPKPIIIEHIMEAL